MLIIPLGEWDMKLSGIVALAHPLHPEIATRHGVFVLEDVDMIRRKYKKGEIELNTLQFQVLYQLKYTSKFRPYLSICFG